MKTSLIFIMLLAAVSMSCKQSTTTTIVEVGPYLGEMTGRVVPLDVNGDSLPSLFAGTTVVLKGSSLDSTGQSIVSSFTTITDSTGQWTLKNVSAGIYRLDFEKAGFDTTEYMEPPAGGDTNIRFSGAGVDFIPDQMVVKMPTDTIVLDNATIRDTVIDGYTGPGLIMSGHITSNNLQYVAVYATLDTVSKAGDGKGWWFTNAGKFSGVFTQVTDPTSGNQVDLSSITSGQKIFICVELWPYPGYPNFVGTINQDYSNTIEVTVP
jgi:hypothetical protein